MMNFKELATKALTEKGYIVKETAVTKANGIVYHGLTVAKEAGQTTCPTFYLDSFEERYSKGEDVLEEFLKHVEENIQVPESICGIQVASTAIKNGYLRLHIMNYELNKELLSSVPHKKILDLAIVVRVHITDEASVLCDTNILNILEIDEEEMFDIATKNSSSEFTFKSMSSILPLPMADDIPSIPMYIATSNSAACMTIDSCMEEVHKKLEEDFYIIPSSRHEVIVLPKSVGEPDALREMIHDVNDNVVDVIDILSYNLYCYDMENRLQIVSKETSAKTA